jgi:integrase
VEHIFRHSAAKLRRDARESVEEVSRFLDHSNLAVTTTYLPRLEGKRIGVGPKLLSLSASN